MTDLGTVLTAIHDADESWQTLRGEIVSWTDHERQMAAWEAAAQEGEGHVVTSIHDGIEHDPPPAEQRWRIWMRRPDESRVEHDDGLRIDGREYHWNVFDGGVQRYPRHERGTSWGGEETLLHPSVLLAANTAHVEGETTIAGRRCWDVALRPRDEVEGPFSFMQMMGEGPRIAVDQERGILLRCEWSFEGVPVHRVQFDSVEFDQPLGDELFVYDGPVTDDGHQSFPDLPQPAPRLSALEQATRYVPRGPEPEDPREAREGVLRAFHAIVDDAADPPLVAEWVQGGSNLTAAAAELAATRPEGEIELQVDHILFLRPDEAVVWFTILFSGMPVLHEKRGRAVNEAGTWKMARETYCELAANAGVQCPPAP